MRKEKNWISGATESGKKMIVSKLIANRYLMLAMVIVLSEVLRSLVEDMSWIFL